MKRLSNQYVAGILDGEGCLGIKRVNSQESKNQCYSVYIKVVMTDYKIPEMLARDFGGNTWERKRTDGWKNSKEWLITGRQRVSKFLEKTSKHLIVKKEQARILREFCSYKTSGHIPPEIVRKRDDLYQQIRELNSRQKSPATTERDIAHKDL